MNRRFTAAVLGAGGLLMMVGGQLHPRGSGDDVDDYLESMLGSSTWQVAHITLLAGVLAAVAGLVMARRMSLFGAAVDRVLTLATVGWSFAALELVPHVLAVRDADALHEHGETPILDLHLLLQVVATPALGIAGVILAISVARAAGTKPAWALAVVGSVGGLAYAAAGPLVNLTDNVTFATLFPAQAGLAVWLIGTAVRVVVGAGRGGGHSGSPASAPDAAPSTAPVRRRADVIRSVLRHDALPTIVGALSIAGMMATPAVLFDAEESAHRS
jgi:hypothetical protein